jgi:ABC-type phosphate transport system substrate-binding protein
MNRLKILLLLGALLWASPFSERAASAAAADIAVVVNPELPIDNLSFVELRKIVLGDRQFWSSNLRVTLLMRAPAARERDVVLKNVVQMTEAQFRQYWIGKVFRAESSAAPKSVYSNEMSFSLLNSIPGSLAFIEASQVPKALKVVRIGGLLPGEKGYPLN